MVEKVKGTADVFDGIIFTGPSVTVEPNYSQLAQYGVTPTDLQFQIQTALEGNTIGSIVENEKTTPIRLIYNNKYQLGIEDLNKLKIILPNGNASPITNLVNITISKGDAEIQRENLQMMSVVTGRLDNRDLGTVMTEIQKEVTASIHMPSGYYIEYHSGNNRQDVWQDNLTFTIHSTLNFVKFYALQVYIKASFGVCTGVQDDAVPEPGRFPMEILQKRQLNGIDDC